MALTTAERQARYKQRLKEAAQGVTVEMVDQVARITWEHARQTDPDLPAWPDFLASLKGKGGQRIWDAHLLDLGLVLEWEDSEVRAAYGEYADLVRKVALVIQASKTPPGLR